jgi:hypothetical protein
VQQNNQSWHIPGFEYRATQGLGTKGVDVHAYRAASEAFVPSDVETRLLRGKEKVTGAHQPVIAMTALAMKWPRLDSDPNGSGLRSHR